LCIRPRKGERKKERTNVLQMGEKADRGKPDIKSENRKTEGNNSTGDRNPKKKKKRSRLRRSYKGPGREQSLVSVKKGKNRKKKNERRSSDLN